MQSEDETFERLRAAIVELAGADATELLVQARADARERVRALLSDALTNSMLEQAGKRLESPDLGWYVYGVIASEDAVAGPELVGIEPSHPVTPMHEGPLAALASRVSLHQFGESPLRAHLADSDWVQRTARAHELALQQIRARCTVIPTRMCTIYSTAGGVRERLRREARGLQHALAHLRGKNEWNVRVFAGFDHGFASDCIEEACARVHERLSAVAADGLLAPSQPLGDDSRAAQMILNGAYLVTDGANDTFHWEVDELGHELARIGIELQITGPSPPYNFVPNAIGAAW
jgi:hypothetical protein